MNRDELEALEVNGQPLPKEAVDFIIRRHGEDIERFKEQEKSINSQLKAANEQIKAFQAMDIDGVKQAAADWQKKYEQAVADHQAQEAEREFMGKLDSVISNAHGINPKAIKALLDLDALRGSKNFDKDAADALEALKQASPEQFKIETPPPFAAGAGTHGVSSTSDPLTASIRAAAGLSPKGD